MRIIIFVLILFPGVHNLVYSQKDPVKFGKIEKADLLMTRYEPDTGVSAVVLCDYGFWNTNEFKFRRVLRIKILKKEGLNYASQVFFGSEKAVIRGITYNLENDKIIETKLNSKSIFVERVFEDYYRLRVAMPNVIVGSVIDLEIGFPGPPDKWHFQSGIPVIWSELRLPESNIVEFKKTYSGYEPLYISERTRWVAKDMPAFKEEPFTNSIENYITKFDIEILSLSFYGNIADFATDWDAVAHRLDETYYFGTQLHTGLFLNTLSKEIEVKYDTDFDRMKAAYEEVKKIKWNGYESLFTSDDGLQKAYKNKTGNSADINLILVVLLRKLNLNCNPVILSTRSNGQINFSNPSLSKLNYVIALVRIKDKEYLLDANVFLLKILPYVSSLSIF